MDNFCCSQTYVWLHFFVYRDIIITCIMLFFSFLFFSQCFTNPPGETELAVYRRLRFFFSSYFWLLFMFSFICIFNKPRFGFKTIWMFFWVLPADTNRGNESRFVVPSVCFKVVLCFGSFEFVCGSTSNIVVVLLLLCALLCSVFFCVYGVFVVVLLFDQT